MKNFKEILAMNESVLKAYLYKFLCSKKYSVVNEDGFLYAKGNLPVLLTAHMDTVHKETVKEIHINDYFDGNDITNKWSSPQGIGGDDRCGVWLIMNLIKEGFRPSVLFCEKEELGSIGAGKFCKTKYIQDLGVNYMIELDRRGKTDAVFYSCDNKEFTKWVQDVTGYQKAIGTMSDISKLMPSSGIAGVNLSVGYFNEHHLEEYIIVEYMNNTLEVVKKLLKTEVDKPWKYVKFVNQTTWGWGDFGNRNYGFGDRNYGFGDSLRRRHFDDLTELKLTVKLLEDYIDDYDYELDTYGNTKAECWMHLFLDNPDLCFDFIDSYHFE